MSMTSVKPLKEDASEGYDEPFNPNTDALNSGGMFVQNTTSSDTNASISRDASDNLTFTDPNGGTKVLSNLATNYDFLLDNEPDAVGVTYSVTRSSGLVSVETWTNTATTNAIKSITYTRTSGLVTTAVHKVFASNGSTVVAQKTETFSRTSGQLTGVTVTRDV